MVQPVGKTSQLGGGEVTVGGCGEAGDDGIQRALCSTKFDELLDEHTLFNGGIGGMVEVKMSRAENGSLKE